MYQWTLLSQKKKKTIHGLTLSPGAPASPEGPVAPVSPVRPFSPAGPGGPGRPWGTTSANILNAFLLHTVMARSY